jgi:hypothetical protein
VTISPGGVRCVWQPHELANMKLRLNALETKVAQQGVVLIEAQLCAQRSTDQPNSRFSNSARSIFR